MARKPTASRSDLRRIEGRLLRTKKPDWRVPVGTSVDDLIAAEKPPGTETDRTWKQVTFDGDVQHWVTFEGPEPDQMTALGLYVPASDAVRRMASRRPY